MLATILKSKVAIKVSIDIMDAFVVMKNIIREVKRYLEDDDYYLKDDDCYLDNRD